MPFTPSLANRTVEKSNVGEKVLRALENSVTPVMAFPGLLNTKAVMCPPPPGVVFFNVTVSDAVVLLVALYARLPVQLPRPCSDAAVLQVNGPAAAGAA